MFCSQSSFHVPLIRLFNFSSFSLLFLLFILNSDSATEPFLFLFSFSIFPMRLVWLFIFLLSSHFSLCFPFIFSSPYSLPVCLFRLFYMHLFVSFILSWSFYHLSSLPFSLCRLVILLLAYSSLCVYLSRLLTCFVPFLSFILLFDICCSFS